MRRLVIIVLPLLLLTIQGALGATASQAGGNQPPVVTIISPLHGAVYAPGATIQFTGTAIDPETGPLGGVQMIWNSNLQPGLGVGTSFTRNNLVAGTHVVTLRATDPRGGQATRSVTIIVGTATATPANTATAVPPTPTNTPTPEPPTATPTNTTVPPTATATLIPPTATATAVPPTATRTATPVPPPPPTAPTPPQGSPRRCADVDGNGRVTWHDLDRIARQLRRPYDARYDINNDGRVNVRDLVAAATQLGRRCKQTPAPTPTKTVRPATPTKTPAPTKTLAPTKTPKPIQATATATPTFMLD